MNASNVTPDDTTPEESVIEAEVELDDSALEQAAGGQNLNSTEIVFASTFVPFDSSF